MTDQVLLAAMPDLTDAAGCRVLRSVRVRSDRMDAIEEVLFREPIYEVLIDVPTHPIASQRHQDLAHRSSPRRPADTI